MVLTIQDGIKQIEPHQYERRLDITELIIADTVEVIGEAAFYGCSNLKRITWGQHVHTIGFGAFWNCFSLESLHLPSSIKYVETCAFDSCLGLTYVEFEDNDEVFIANNVFSNCAELTCAILPIGLKHIYEETFFGCSKLEDVFIPETVISIGTMAFFGVAAEQVELPDSLLAIGDWAFYDSRLTSVDIPDSVIGICESVFGHCRNLRSVEIGKSVKYIERKAFEDCPAIREVTFRSTTIDFIGANVLKGCKNLKRINVPASAMDKYKSLLRKHLHKKLVGF